MDGISPEGRFRVVSSGAMQVSPDGPKASSVVLDAADHRILEALSRDARQSVTALAQSLHLSRAATYERISRLRAAGVLQGFTAVIDRRRAGQATAAYVFLTLKQDDWEVLRSGLADEPAVQHLALVGGQYDAVLLVRTSSVEELRRVIFERIQSLGCVESTQTALIFDDHAEHRYAVPEKP